MGDASEHRYLVALGSNRRVPGLGAPRAVLAGAVAALARSGWEVEAVARVIDSAPVGPSLRRYANGAAIIAGGRAPPVPAARLRPASGGANRARLARSGLRPDAAPAGGTRRTAALTGLPQHRLDHPRQRP
ncbi:hypothetical protein [Erythrobacter sp. HI0077]|uniref:hypothetical protein n=1 Tax=Erythrobacter sp. HI0077 TaxID=1822252 RepID=UPI000B048693